MFDSLKKLFTENMEEKHKETKEVKTSSYKNTLDGKIRVNIIYVAPNTYLAQRAARICVGSDNVSTDIESRLKYIENICKTKHESVIEHTNVIFVLSIDMSEYTTEKATDLNEILCNSKYLYTSTNTYNGSVNVLFGGSIRGYLHIIRETRKDNTLLFFILKALMGSVEKQFLVSLVEENVLDDIDKFVYILGEELDPKELNETDRVTLVYSTNVPDVTYRIRNFGFSYYDAMKVSTVSFIIHDISRSCGNQITRHRNAISQESQRYVTHGYDSNDYFVDPISLQLETRYEKLDKSIVDEITSKDKFDTYKYLLSKGVKKEDARAYLPMNVKTRLMMTFTLYSLWQFIDLRTDTAAQLEIMKVARDMKHYIINGDINVGINNEDIPEVEDLIMGRNGDNFGFDYFPYNSTIVKREDNVVDEELPIQDEEDIPTDLDLSTLEKAKAYMNKNEEIK